MSTPPGQNELWKNCTWKNAEEKLAFFNHYFKNSDIVASHMRDTLSSLKSQLIRFIESGKIREGNNERDITMKDVIAEIRNQ
jgi:hypothetical protein